MDTSLKELAETLYKFDNHQEALPIVFGKVVEVFQKLSSDSEKISPATKEAWCTNCQEVLCKLITLIQPSINRVSISEELLVQSLDNPNYFNADDWSIAQKGKEEIIELFQKILLLFFDQPFIEDDSKDAAIEKKHPLPKSPNKADWMKS